MVGYPRWSGARFHARGGLSPDGMGEHVSQCGKFRLVQAAATTSSLVPLATSGMGTTFPTAFGRPTGYSGPDSR